MKLSDLQRMDISSAVYSIYENNIKQGSPKQQYLATPLSYLFSMTISTLRRPITLKLHKNQVNGDIKKWVTFKSNGIERVLPVLGNDDVHLLYIFINPKYTESDKVSINVSLQKLYRQATADAIVLFDKLGIQVHRGSELKALRDIRIADLIINKNIDYGWLSSKSLGYYRSHFYSRNIFSKQIEEYQFDSVLRDYSVVKK